MKALFWICVLLQILTTPLAAADVAPAVETNRWQKGTDPLGDPLPRGAIRRFGSNRLSHKEHVSCIAYSPDGKWLASGSYDGTVRLWNLRTYEEEQRIVVPVTPDKVQRYQIPRWVRDIVWSPDSKTIYACSDGEGIYGWEISSGKMLHHFAPQEEISILHLAISFDGKLLGTGESDFQSSEVSQRRVSIWNLETGKQIHRVKVPNVYSVSFSPDAKLLAIGGNPTLRLLNVATGQEEPELQGGPQGVHAVAFSRDGKYLASSDLHGKSQVHLWEMPSRRRVRQIDSKNWSVSKLAFSPDSSRLVSAGAASDPQSPVTIWDVASGKPVVALPKVLPMIYSVAFSADGKTVATVASGGIRGWGERAIRLWDAATGRELFPFPRHRGEVTAVSLTADGQTLATGSFDQTVQLWNLKTGTPLATLSSQAGAVHAITFSPDGRSLATGSGEQTAQLWDPNSGKVLRRLRADRPGLHPTLRRYTEVLSVAYSPDGRILAAGEGENQRMHMPGAAVRDSPVLLWDLATGQELRRLQAEKSGMVNALAFTPDGRFLASAGIASHLIRIWDVAAGKPVVTLGVDENQQRDPNLLCEGFPQLLFSPDGKTLISLSRYTNFHNMSVPHRKDDVVRAVRVWDVETANERFNIPLPRHSITAIALSPDGKTLMLGHRDGLVSAWSLATQRRQYRFVAHRDVVSAITFTPDGKYLITGSWDTTAVLWDLSKLQ